jgi:hypothetical protein
MAVLLAGSTGCRSTAPDAKSLLEWGWENARDAKAHLDCYKHIFVACIYEDHWEDRGPHEYSRYHFKATVARVYKGDWRVSERGSFVEGLDYPVPKVWNSNAGRLILVLTDKHTNGEIYLDTGDRFNYGPKLERVLQFLYPNARLTRPTVRTCESAKSNFLSILTQEAGTGPGLSLPALRSRSISPAVLR